MLDFQSFDSFDPLEAKTEADTEVKLKALKNEIKGILTSYVGWYDPFCETIQNAMDAVEKRANRESNYDPKIWITINLQDNMLIVTDNGIGLDEKQFKSFLSPFFSFKSRKNRGHKGVGATYLAYGFNYIQLCTKTPSFTTVGKMIGARNWVDDDETSLLRPQVSNDIDGPLDKHFKENNDTGVSICIKFDKGTFPKNLNWVGMRKASAWLKVLRFKTALGGIQATENLEVFLDVIDKQGNLTQESIKKPTYLWIHETSDKSLYYKDIEKKRKELFDRNKNPENLPKNFMNRFVIYGQWDFNSLIESSKQIKLNLNEEDYQLLTTHKPYIYCAYVWSVKHWNNFHQELEYRSSSKSKILYGGIQLIEINFFLVDCSKFIGKKHNELLHRNS